MRSVVISLVMLTAIVGANPTRLARDAESIASAESAAKSDSSSLLELPEPGPIEESELAEKVEAPAEPVAPAKPVESALRKAPSVIDELTTRKPTGSVLPVQEPEEVALPVTPSAPSIPALDIFELLPEQPTVEVCDETSAPGRSKVYCSGRLLASVNLHHIFKDSKTFVDRPIKVNQTQEEIMADFESRFPPKNEDIDPEQLRAFVEQHFDQEGHELENCEVLDWSTHPAAFEEIKDPVMKKFASELNAIWKELCRKIKPMVGEDERRFSLLNVPNNFIVPGGRFREFYYWDTYWVVKGLLASGMYNTTRGMLENFGTIVNRVGFIPNGGRVYYLKRSQPPLLAAMVYEYYEATRNVTFLKEMLPLLEKELKFWQDQRNVTVTVNGVNHTMFQYRTEANVPRPESYREDSLIGANFQSKGRQQQLYRDIGSAAESGWDFSTRWFADHKSLISIHTTDIVPVDLNAFICYNLNILSFFYGEIADYKKERAFLNDYNSFKVSFGKVFYKPEAKGWYDYDAKNRLHNTDFFPSIAVPLFTGCYDQLSLTQSGDLLDKMKEMGALNLKGGIPTSLANHTQEQWDFPNGWSPLNHMVIEGLRKSNNPRLQQEAFLLAQKWVRSNHDVYEQDRAMWEKYNVKTNEARGSGGEYEVQAGFGWSNGVVLDLLLTYGDRLTVNDSAAHASSNSPKLEHVSAMPIVSGRPTAKTTTSPASSSFALSPLHLALIAVAAILW